jgi:hypothetical protein
MISGRTENPERAADLILVGVPELILLPDGGELKPERLAPIMRALARCGGSLERSRST